MQLISVVEKLMLKLGTLPGLGFLTSYVIEFRGKVGAGKQEIGKYTTYVQTVRSTAGDVKKAAGGLKNEEESDPEEEEVEDIDDNYEEDDESYLQ
jgi:hypothetical protein